MDWKEYREQPDSGLFENIARRVRHRRLMRWGGAAAGVAAVVAVLCVVLWPSGKAVEPVAGQMVAMQQKPVDTAPVVADRSGEALQPATSEMPVAVKPNQNAAKDSTLVISTKEEVADSRQQEVAGSRQQVTANSYPQTANDVETKPAAESRSQQQKQPLKAVAQTETAEEHVPAPTAVSPAKSDPIEENLHEDNLFWTPNIIVPSGDVDANRTFSVKFTSAVSNFHIYIYNRAGHQVYQTSDPSFVWDGTSKGTTLPQGAYIWVMKFRDTAGKPHEERGTVTLIR